MNSALISAQPKQSKNNCNFKLYNVANEDFQKITLTLSAICMQVEVEFLIQSLYAKLVKFNPLQLELLMFYAYPHFGNRGELKVTDIIIKKCEQLLNRLYAVYMLYDVDSEIAKSEIDRYVEGVRGLVYAHQTERKIKALGIVAEEHFMKEIGFNPQRILDIIRAIFQIYHDKESKQVLIISYSDLDKAVSCSRSEWQILLEKFALTKEKRLHEIRSIADLRQYPIYALNDENVLVSNPHHFLEVIWERFQVKIEEISNFQVYQEKRSDFLEDLLVSFLEKVFPGQVRKGVDYRLHTGVKGKTELDVLVIHDDTALVFEAKAVRYFRPAASERMGLNYVYALRAKDSIVEASVQGKRFKKFCKDDQRAPQILGPGILRVKRFFLFGVTLDPLINFGFNTEILYEQDNNFPLLEDLHAICIDDLELILDYLSAPEQFIDYMEKRSKMINRCGLRIGDELDLLADYLDAKMMPVGSKGIIKIISGGSVRFDEKYYGAWLLNIMP